MFRPLRTSQLVTDVAMAGVFAGLVVWPELGIGATEPAGVLSAILVVVLFASALAVRRAAPGLALGIAWGAAIVQMGFQRTPGPSDIAVFAVLYTSAAYGSRRVYWAGFASAIVGAVVITVYLFAGPLRSEAFDLSTITAGIALLVAGLFALLLAWTVGALVRSGMRARENRAGELRAQAETAAEQERVRIARDMHDVVAHSLAVVIAQADGARYAAASDPGVTAQALGTISSTARSALADVRLLLTQLRHAQGEGPQPTLTDLEELYAHVRAAGVDLRVDVDPAPRADPPAAVQLAVYRILQEALTNALRHGDEGPVQVRQQWLPDRLDVEVRNAVAADATPGAGHGVIGMRERAQLVGGTLSAVVEDGAFVVRATVPLRGERD